MKIIPAIILMLLISCSSKEDDYKDKYSQYEPMAKYKRDSMQIINKFIDGLPIELKSNQHIRDAYMRNLDVSRQIANNDLILLSQDLDHYDSVRNAR